MTPRTAAVAAALLLLACTASGHRASPDMTSDPKDKLGKDYRAPPLPRGHVVLHDPYGGAHRVQVEIAADDDSRERGLMWRQRLAAGSGMLFAFPTSAEHSFWMKNTLIPLDMIFITRDRRVVGVVANAQPGDLHPMGPEAESEYVLEVPGGWAAAQGIAPGSRVEIEGLSMLEVR
jgi:uncharacterized membrane protein (UPF0127 family)